MSPVPVTHGDSADELVNGEIARSERVGEIPDKSKYGRGQCGQWWANHGGKRHSRVSGRIYGRGVEERVGDRVESV